MMQGLKEKSKRRGINISVYVPESLFPVIDHIDERSGRRGARSKWICSAIENYYRATVAGESAPVSASA